MTVPAQVISFAPHWRHEVGDVADTLREVIDVDRRPERVIGGGRLPVPRRGGRSASVVVVSDTADAPSAGGRTDQRVVRLWWNGADEVLAHRAGEDSGELDVVFFPDVAAELAEAGRAAVFVPYAFARPSSGVSMSTTSCVGFTGEVDISAACFASMGDDGAVTRPTAEQLHRRARDLGAAVVSGERTLLAVTDEILGDRGPDVEVARTLLWSVRNQVRHGLLADVAAAFPGRLVLRGDDWRALGFDALPTSHNRRRRIRGYRTHLVSLDLGSKSTNASLYPRSVEIMALAGGLAQFHTGLPAPGAHLEARRASSAEALVELVGALLDLPDDEARRRNQALRAEYEQLRLVSGRTLLGAITAVRS